MNITKYKIKAIPSHESVEEGEKIIKIAIESFGRIDVLINNAGILRDKSLNKLTINDWELVIRIHLNGSFKCLLAAWNYFKKQNYGRVINTGSSSGLFGNFGQINYSAAKSGIHGITMTAAKEGESFNIKVNTIAPIAATNMTQKLFSNEILEAVNPKYVVPLVALLSHDSCPENGSIYEVGGGWVSKIRLQRSKGIGFPIDFTPEQLLEKWNEVIDFSNECDYPTSGTDSIEKMLKNYEYQKNKIKKFPKI